MATAEHGLNALWDVLKKRGRTKHLAYQPAIFEFTPGSPSVVQKTSPVHGYLIHYASKADAPFAVLIGGMPGGETIVVAGSLDRFNRLTGAPAASDLEKAKLVVVKSFQKADRKRRDAAVADLAMTALNYGCFEPDIIQQIGSLAYKPGMAEV